jgi:hypothetical protein
VIIASPLKILPIFGKALDRKNLLAKFKRSGESTVKLETEQSKQSMDIHHPFLSEFPQHREIVRHLRLSDNKFREMFEEYHQLDDAVCRIEEEIEFATDQAFDELKFKRAKLKDALYSAVSRATVVA